MLRRIVFWVLLVSKGFGDPGGGCPKKEDLTTDAADQQIRDNQPIPFPWRAAVVLVSPLVSICLAYSGYKLLKWLLPKILSPTWIPSWAIDDELLLDARLPAAAANSLNMGVKTPWCVSFVSRCTHGRPAHLILRFYSNILLFLIRGLPVSWRAPRHTELMDVLVLLDKKELQSSPD